MKSPSYPNGFVNLAYTDQTAYDLSQFHDATVIDLCATPIQSVVIDNFPNLKRLRTQRCSKLTTFKVTNCPNLEVIDTSYTQVTSENCLLSNLPKLRCLDISFTKINSLGDAVFPNLECLMAKSTNYFPTPQSTPNLLTAELGMVSPNSFPSSFYQLEKLERLIFNVSFHDFINLNELAQMKNLTYLNIFGGKVDLSSFPNSNTRLQYLKLEGTIIKVKGEVNVKYIYLDKKYNKLPPIPEEFPSWIDSYRLLYGPWGIPPCDQMKKVPTVLKQKLPFDKIKTDVVLDGILGAVLGSAIGDAIGVKSEFHRHQQLAFDLSCPLDISWSHMAEYRPSPLFMIGASTDDTDQSVFIMRSLQTGKPDILHFARLMLEWVEYGIVEHKHGRCYDRGTTTHNTLRHRDFMINPAKAARETMKEYSVGNGSAMRTSSVGCFKFWDEKEVMNNAKLFSEATHAHPECIFGAV